ncbi:hypothetical protein B506_02254 [Lactobacillus delbrueckii subsp. jakobsenii ZN7a-9 = DSM 26046]|nr:hypothetical protein B506_02254 [Lactobacillus delbrueckii subsp. jakobsenii ZN7a-9 = DSM 26046]
MSTHKVNDAFLSAVDDELLLLLEHADKLKAANTAALLKAAFLKKLIFFLLNKQLFIFYINLQPLAAR